MKVAIDSGPLTSGDSVRGIGVYARELLKALNLEGVDVTREDLGKYDVVHFTRFHPFFVSVPWNKPKNTKFILTIYDLIQLIYPKHYPPGVRGSIKYLINKYLIKRNIDAIVTISETSKKDICRFLEVDPKKVFVTYLAPREIFKPISNTSILYKRSLASQGPGSIEVEYKLPKKFALYVGDINYNKNIPALISACRQVKIPLVIGGEQAAQIDKLDLNHAEHKHLKNVDWTDVIRLGFVSDLDLVKIYNLAAVYVQPSLYEGFGLPAVQAVACGTPLVVAKSQCMVEILGNNLSYCDPNDAKSIAKAISNPNIGKKLSRDYSWGKTAKETYSIYQGVAGLK